MTPAHQQIKVSFYGLGIAPSGTMAERITQELFIVQKSAKNKLLRKLLAQYRGSLSPVTVTTPKYYSPFFFGVIMFPMGLSKPIEKIST